MSMAQRIKERRLAMNLTQDELAQKLGLQKSAVAKYENGRVENIKRSVIQKMSLILDCTPAHLMGWDEDESEQEAGLTPVYTAVSAGHGTIADEANIEQWMTIPKELADKGVQFGLRVKGCSMEPEIKDGDIVWVKECPDAQDGDIVIALVNGDEGYCKRLRLYGNALGLISNNADYSPMIFPPDQVESIPVRILGKVVGLYRFMGE